MASDFEKFSIKGYSDILDYIGDGNYELIFNNDIIVNISANLKDFKSLDLSRDNTEGMLVKSFYFYLPVKLGYSQISERPGSLRPSVEMGGNGYIDIYYAINTNNTNDGCNNKLDSLAKSLCSANGLLSLERPNVTISIMYMQTTEIVRFKNCVIFVQDFPYSPSFDGSPYISRYGFSFMDYETSTM